MLESQAIVSKTTEVVPEHLLVQIPEQVKGFDADIGAFQLALEQAPKVFESVSVNLPINVPFSVVNDLMLESLLLESLIGHERIGIDRAPCFHVSANVRLQRVLFAIANDSGANFAAAFEDSHDSGFILGASLSNPALVFVGVHEASGTANESFVYFNFAIRTAEFQKRAVLHGKANPMEHKPSGLLSDAQSAANLVRANTVLAVRNHPNCDKPLVEGNRRIFHDGSDLDRELPMGMHALALPLPLIIQEHGIFTSASGAGHNTVRPAKFDHELEAVVGIGEVNDGLLESLWFGAHGVPHKPNSSLAAMICQVYYCLCKC